MHAQGKLTNSNLMKNWADFKSVVHLWSAYNIIKEEKRTERIDSRESLSDLLSIAEAFREAGVAARGLRSADTWTVLGGNIIPVHERTVEVPPLDEAQLSILNCQNPT